MGWRLGLVFLFSTLCFSSAHAYESEDTRGYVNADQDEYGKQGTDHSDKISLAPGERLRKFNIALNALNVPQEDAPDFSEFPPDSAVTQNEVQARLHYMDPQGGLQRYLSFQSSTIALFQDFWSMLLPQNLLEYSLHLKSDGTSEDSRALINHLMTIAAQVKDPTQIKPLAGLKIVIDPGHMGTNYWDTAGGKFVKVNGVKVSEGQINLWTAFLVSNQLENRGATVTLTRTVNGTVAQTTPTTYDKTKYIHQALYNSRDDWMDKYLTQLSDTDLSSTIASKPEVKSLYSNAQTVNLFIMGEDLEARSLIIDREKPDVVLDIHFDANQTNALQSSVNSLEAFVPGAFQQNETGARQVRAQALKHLLEIQRWNESVALAGEITQSMSTSTHVPLLRDQNFMATVKVQDGVYARNLYINRRNLSALMVYLECLHYDNTSEFSNLAKNTETGFYHGMSFSYPARLNSVASGISTGLLNYFKR